MLDEGVVAEPQDIDLCLILGAGWPFHLGGISPYLDRTGVSERVTGRRFLPPGVAGVPAASGSQPLRSLEAYAPTAERGGRASCAAHATARPPPSSAPTPRRAAGGRPRRTCVRCRGR